MEDYERVYNPVADVIERGYDSLWWQFKNNVEFSIHKVLENMLELTARGFGDEPWGDVSADTSNRATALSNTDFIMLTAFVPTTRLKRGLNWFHDSLTYMGPSDSDTVFS